jgi:MoaA/NifB/PqqE/SkfB family radical SAM enzyme
MEEYKKIASALEPFSILAIGGGEPFLNDDLEKICSIFIEKCQVDTLFIPTNGTLTEKILMTTEKILEKFPRVSISINPSLDGMADFHDKNRGISGTFSRCVETIQQLTKLKKKYANLQVIVNSVICRDNLSELRRLMEFLQQFEIDFQAFELMRGDQRNKNLNLPSREKIMEMHEDILRNRWTYLLKKKDKVKNKWFFKLEEIAVLGTLKYAQQFKEKVLSGKKWPADCVAGKNIAVINPDGNFSTCELSAPLANLRQYSYSLPEILKDEKTVNFMENIKKRKCDCTHICFINSAIAGRPASIFGILKGYLKARKIIKKC